MKILSSLKSNFVNRFRYQKIQVSNMFSSGEKNINFFISYKDHDHKIKASHIMLPKSNA